MQIEVGRTAFECHSVSANFLLQLETLFVRVMVLNEKSSKFDKGLDELLVRTCECESEFVLLACAVSQKISFVIVWQDIVQMDLWFSSWTDMLSSKRFSIWRKRKHRPPLYKQKTARSAGEFAIH